jgi:hypothetical protein
MKRMERVQDIVNLIERCPLRHYAAPDDELDRTRYGYGIFLSEADANRLIRCLRQVLSNRRGRPPKDEDEKQKQASEDRSAFESEVATLNAAGKSNPKTLAYEKFEGTWNLTNRAVRARVRTAYRLAPFFGK